MGISRPLCGLCKRADRSPARGAQEQALYSMAWVRARDDLLSKKCSRVLQLGPIGVGARSQLEKLRIIGGCRVPVPGQLGSHGRARDAAEAVRLPEQRGLEFETRGPGIAQLEEQLAQ